MKKLKFLILFAVNSLFISAQPYGQTQYQGLSVMSSGYRTGLNPLNGGFIMAGLKGSNFHIDKTKSGGLVPSYIGLYSFERDYSVSENGSCSSISGNPVTPPNGVCAVEMLQSNRAWYAVAGAYTKGCFVTFLAPDGTVISTLTFPFPSTASQINRPTIIIDPNTLNMYVCGSYNSDMYVIKLSASGSVLWSSFYNAGNCVLIQPRDMIISGHTGEIVIVGHMSPDWLTYNSASDAFFMALNPSNGNVNVFRNYNSTPCNWFNSVKTSKCTAAGGIGYVVGGYTDPFFNKGGALMMKLDITGNVLWNTLITSGSPGIIANEIMGIVERVNTSGQFEYYGVAKSYDNNTAPPQLSDMTVFKLNASGNPASGFNEYHYGVTSSSQLRPVNLSFDNNSSGTDVGLHVYADNIGIGHYLQESYFNGITGCPNLNLTYMPATEVGPSLVNMPVIKFGSLPICNKLNVTNVVAGVTPIQLCSSTSLIGGSNAKSSAVTGIRKEDSAIGMNIYPNPGIGLYTVETEFPAQIKIYNLLGEIVREGSISSGKNSIDLLNEANGVYIIKIFDGFETKTLQLVKN